MKALAFTLFLALICSIGFAQNKLIDSLTHELAIAKNDTSQVLIMSDLSYRYRVTKLDSAMKYAQQALVLAQKINFPKGEAKAINNIGYVFRESGDLPKAVNYALKALRIAEEHQDTDVMGACINTLAVIYYDLKEYPKAINFYQQAVKINKNTRNQYSLIGNYVSIGASYLNMNQLDSGKYYVELVYDGVKKMNSSERLPTLYRLLGWVQSKSGNNQLALYYFKKGIQESIQINDRRNAAFNYNETASLFQQMNQPDSCIFYAKKGLVNAQLGPYNIRILESSTLLTAAYKAKSDFKLAYEYQDLMVKTKESLYGAGNIQAMQTMIADDEARRKEVETEKITYQNKLKQYSLIVGMGIMLLIGFILYRNNRQKQKANAVLEKTLNTLKSTQAQLIQSEKLASLGELTAGIAHEIQNPLNFVNNFSELSVDLVKDLKEEIDKPNIDKEYIGELFDDLSQNQAKINHHGKRASSIVSGMLEHSKASTGERALTDLNKLADEYLRLSYHGMRAKDPLLNADYELITDPDLPKIEVIPQDMGRVLLNLINNAFWAVKTVEKPLVAVKTEHTGNQLTIKVTDNGTGMTDEVKAKIFQPFFTTKPTGQGTGLGLSLAYDIVTKGHGGTIEVETKEGEGTTFVVKLPIKTI